MEKTLFFGLLLLVALLPHQQSFAQAEEKCGPGKLVFKACEVHNNCCNAHDECLRPKDKTDFQCDTEFCSCLLIADYSKCLDKLGAAGSAAMCAAVLLIKWPPGGTV
uniref:Uncharacterized protein n=1 Tax=Plectus sambesii TaxID=2011161 RepID=A0A914WTC9_9BILA